ncbi:CBS domain-containing protein [Halomonas stenophila]|uniref:CBS domain-containing protein n=1 Tax=Halomonas stenophila TaxID=795312 RepID=A0A7W5ES70_9GAMM|nr:CBS domain-containing protein [Halomonas stenophila]MBB3229681.1 CBS domain-containing protein [Halomonas stenophila]
MLVKEVMTRRPDFLDGTASIRQVAEHMRDRNSGFEPLVDQDKIVGVVTDRDIALRAVAEGRGADDPARDIATDPPLYTYEDDTLEDVLSNMQQQRVQRLLVLDSADTKRLTGILTIGDIADHCQDDDLARALVGCTRHYV